MHQRAPPFMGKRLWDVIGQAQPQHERLPLGEVGEDNRPDWIAGYRPREIQRPRRCVGDCGKGFEEFFIQRRGVAGSYVHAATVSACSIDQRTRSAMNEAKKRTSPSMLPASSAFRYATLSSTRMTVHG